MFEFVRVRVIILDIISKYDMVHKLVSSVILICRISVMCNSKKLLLFFSQSISLSIKCRKKIKSPQQLYVLTKRPRRAEKIEITSGLLL
jgi:hypothetical protein